MMNENSLSCKKQMHLPPEVLSEILSWLDVDSLLRFKTVCKEWCYLIEDPTFICSHMMKSRGHWIFEMVADRPPYNTYMFVDSYFGLILEHKYVTQCYRLTNPSTRNTPEFVQKCTGGYKNVSHTLLRRIEIGCSLSRFQGFDSWDRQCMEKDRYPVPRVL